MPPAAMSADACVERLRWPLPPKLRLGGLSPLRSTAAAHESQDASAESRDP